MALNCTDERIKNMTLFAKEKKPRRGLMAFEWIVLAYLLGTTLMILFMYTRMKHPETMLLGRTKILAMTLALWGVYRLYPCRFTRLTRVVAHLALLSWWYPDTYELNRVLPNLDHIFANWEQAVFGFQPALLFSKAIPNHVFSELMDLGYASYFPMIALVSGFYFFCRYKEFERATTIILGAFFIYYVIFVFLPVTGPQYYFQAVGEHQIAQGIFPNLHDYFNTHNERMISPGWTDGIFYQLVEDAHNAGERPTAAFPSSHVGITTILMLLAWHTRNRHFFWILMPFFILMCFATVYIKAHYAIDAIAGLVSGVLIYIIMWNLTRRLGEQQRKKS
ncbi:MAG: phosphatase PAP2 family protein [Prevotella sp.]|nr:phosphatase PAP2 family protein [Prevotella sp.]MBR3445397.1 phosphatase PAP2 family protein [Prevotella sp.]